MMGGVARRISPHLAIYMGSQAPRKQALNEQLSAIILSKIYLVSNLYCSC